MLPVKNGGFSKQHGGLPTRSVGLAATTLVLLLSDTAAFIDGGIKWYAKPMWIYPVIKRVGLGLGLEDGSKTSCLCYPEAIVLLRGRGIVPSESFSFASLDFFWSRLRPRRRSFLFSANWISASWGWATASHSPQLDGPLPLMPAG